MDKIICVGKNYAEHVQEMRAMGDKHPEKPVLFLKPPSALVACETEGGTVRAPLPLGRGSVHHECEIAARIRISQGQPILDAVTLGLDMTLRDTQAELKKNGQPWEIAKVFEASAILGPWIAVRDFPGYLDEEFSFSLDGQVRQRGRGREMRIPPEDCLRHAAERFPLRDGDVLLTGTPGGVGPVTAGARAQLRWGERLFFNVVWS